MKSSFEVIQHFVKCLINNNNYRYYHHLYLDEDQYIWDMEDNLINECKTATLFHIANILAFDYIVSDATQLNSIKINKI